MNLSSESADPLLFAGVGWSPYNPFAIPPLGGGDYVQQDCFNITYSAISQALADLLAANNATLCVPGTGGTIDPPLTPWPPLPPWPTFDWNPPTFVPPGTNYQQFTNERQVATVSCPDGSIFSYAVEAGTLLSQYIDPSLGPIMVDLLNAQALAWAQQQVWALRICMDVPGKQFRDPNPPADWPPGVPWPPTWPPGSNPIIDPPTDWPPDVHWPPASGNPTLSANPGWCCLGADLDPALNAYSLGAGSAAFTFSITSGALAPGTGFLQTGPRTAEVGGMPTAPGVYTYTVTAVQNGNPSISVSTTDTLKVFGMTTTSLPNGVIGTAYSEPLVTAGGTAPVTFTLVGSLPDGLTLSTGGLISGIPTTAGTSSFTVKFTDAEGGHCQQDLSIIVTGVPGPCSGLAHVYTVTGYGPLVAALIASYWPTADTSTLPEWDGIFRDNGAGGSSSNRACYAINGKAIELNMIGTFLDSLILCDYAWSGNFCCNTHSGGPPMYLMQGWASLFNSNWGVAQSYRFGCFTLVGTYCTFATPGMIGPCEWPSPNPAYTLIDPVLTIT